MINKYGGCSRWRGSQGQHQSLSCSFPNMAPTLPSVVFPLLVVSTGYASATPGHLQRRLENGLALTPPMG